MKHHAFLAASVIAAASLFATGAIAADQPAETGAPAAQKPAAPKKIKPHSHMEEKGYAPGPAKTTTTEGKSASDRSDKHLHPRDAK